MAPLQRIALPGGPGMTEQNTHRRLQRIALFWPLAGSQRARNNSTGPVVARCNRKAKLHLLTTWSILSIGLRSIHDARSVDTIGFLHFKVPLHPVQLIRRE